MRLWSRVENDYREALSAERYEGFGFLTKAPPFAVGKLEIG
jgi:hypothetical protein